MQDFAIQHQLRQFKKKKKKVALEITITQHSFGCNGAARF